MSGSGKRIDCIVQALTPKQVVLAMIAEGRHCDSPQAYLRWYEVEYERLYQPLQSIVDGIRASLKNQQKRSIDQAVVKALSEALFLDSLYLRLQWELLEGKTERLFTRQLLSAQLRAMIEAFFAREDWKGALGNILQVYPLHAKDASAITASRGNCQLTFAELESWPIGVFGGPAGVGSFEGRVGDVNWLVIKWVTASFIEQGRPTIPLAAYLERIARTRNRRASSLELREDEILTLFKSTAAYQDFACERDSSFGFADVLDQEFQSKLRSVLHALRELVASGSIKAAVGVLLPSVPLAPLRCITLIEGERIDRHVVELAEFGAMLADYGFTLAADGCDTHPLAWPLICAPEGSALDAAALRNQAAANMSNFAGRSTSIEGRPYLSLVDYQGWSQRKLRGELKCLRGFSIDSFNRWADRNRPGIAELSGVRVEPIYEPRMTNSDFAVYSEIEDDQEAQQWRRHAIGRFMDDDLRSKTPKIWNSWRQAFHTHAPRVLSMRASIEFVQHKYFAGHEILLKNSKERSRDQFGNAGHSGENL